MIEVSPVITTSTYQGVISSYHTLFHDHDVRTVWSLVKSFYPWSRDVWSHAIFFTGVKCSYEFQLRRSEQGNVKSKGISNEEVVCTEIGIQRSLIIYSPHLKEHCQPCAQVLLHSFILSSYCPWVELPTLTFETLLLLTASSLPL